MNNDLMTRIEQVINCGNDDYFLIKEKFACALFTHPVQPVQMIYYQTLLKKFKYEELDKELVYGVWHMAVDVYAESIDSIIEKMKEYCEKQDRYLVCPYIVYRNEKDKKKIKDAMNFIFKNDSSIEHKSSLSISNV